MEMQQCSLTLSPNGFATPAVCVTTAGFQLTKRLFSVKALLGIFGCKNNSDDVNRKQFYKQISNLGGIWLLAFPSLRLTGQLLSHTLAPFSR